jgi:hypothetical protein
MTRVLILIVTSTLFLGPLSSTSRLQSPQDTNEILTVLSPPYSACVLSPTPNVKNEGYDLLLKGFLITASDCSVDQGTMKHKIIMMGGANGSASSPADYDVTVSSGIAIQYVPKANGNLTAEITLVTTAHAATGAGSAFAIPTIQTTLEALMEYGLTDLLKSYASLLSVYDIGSALTKASFAGLQSNTFLRVKGSSGLDEVVESRLLKKDLVASFPLPPFSQEAVLNGQETQLTLTVPVKAGDPILIETGVQTRAFVHGWASATWMQTEERSSYVKAVTIREAMVIDRTQPMYEFSGTVFDDQSKRFQPDDGYWTVAYSGYEGQHLLLDNASGTPVRSARWLLNPASSGKWEVFVFIPDTGTTSSARYKVYHNGRTDEAAVSQIANQNRWVSLGTFDFAGQGEEYVELNNETSEPAGTARIAYDAVGINWVGEERSFPQCSGLLGTLALIFTSYGLGRRKKNEPQ